MQLTPELAFAIVNAVLNPPPPPHMQAELMKALRGEIRLAGIDYPDDAPIQEAIAS